MVEIERTRAVLHGGIPPDVVLPRNLAEVLDQAARQESRGDLVCRTVGGEESTQTYAQFLDEAESILAGLRRVGTAPGQRVILQVDEPSEFLAAIWGCVLGGIVPVVLPTVSTTSPATVTTTRLVQTWTRLNGPLVLTTGLLAGTLAAGGGSRDLAFGSERLVLLEELRSNPPDRDWSPGADEDPAVVMITSGTTTTPKMVRLSHRNLLASAVGSAVMNQLGPEDVSVNWLPLHHIGGLMRSLRDVYLGCRQVQVATAWVREDPLRWLDVLHEHRANMTWAPNAALAMVVERMRTPSPRRDWDLRALRSLCLSGEPIVARTVREFHERLEPHGLAIHALHASWGMTEACSATSSRTVLLDVLAGGGQPPHMGRPAPGVSVRIAGDDDRIVLEGTVGHVQIQGPMVTGGYEDDRGDGPAAFTPDGWLRTGDLGVIQDGHLAIVGRHKDLIISGGVKYSPVEVEAAVEELSGVEPGFTAACLVRPAADHGETLAIFFHAAPVDPADPVRLAHAIRARVARALGLTPRFVIPVPKSSIPKGEIGKIQRARLREHFASGAFDASRHWPFDLMSRPAEVLKARPITGAARRIAALIAETTGVPRVGPRDHFFALGGTSLQAAHVIARLSREFPDRCWSEVDLFRAPTPLDLAVLLHRRADDLGDAARGCSRGMIRRAARDDRRLRANRRVEAKPITGTPGA